uniref:Uncharacterized protein n=1 Tax=Arundo donax TaxID=35708 RepID=A0A0A9DR82_ARUDO
MLPLWEAGWLGAPWCSVGCYSCQLAAGSSKSIHPLSDLAVRRPLPAVPHAGMPSSQRTPSCPAAPPSSSALRAHLPSCAPSRPPACGV